MTGAGRPQMHRWLCFHKTSQDDGRGSGVGEGVSPDKFRKLGWDNSDFLLSIILCLNIEPIILGLLMRQDDSIRISHAKLP